MPLFDQEEFVCALAKKWGHGFLNDPDGLFCAFEFPSCRGCPKSVGAGKSSACSSDDPMKAQAWRDVPGPLSAGEGGRPLRLVSNPVGRSSGTSGAFSSDVDAGWQSRSSQSSQP
ncbi:hypothetical protein [Rhodopseudomonas sp. NSM]|uniref:hypothetical protein n=1 Tax=Rhodopseudomonas sp. NSM TaxID=3457630 RepID=UPI004035A75A